MANEIVGGADDAAHLLFSQVVKELSGLRPAADQPSGIVFFKNGVEQIYLKVTLGSNAVEINVGGEKGVIQPRALESVPESESHAEAPEA